MKRHCIYKRTDAGRKAWESQSSGLPAAYRSILGLIERPTHCAEVISRMAEHPERQVWGWLDELDTLCFVESIGTSTAEAEDGLHRRAA